MSELQPATADRLRPRKNCSTARADAEEIVENEIAA